MHELIADFAVGPEAQAKKAPADSCKAPVRLRMRRKIETYPLPWMGGAVVHPALKALPNGPSLSKRCEEIFQIRERASLE